MRTIPDLREQIDEVRRSDILASREFLSRFALVLTGSVIGWFWLGLDIIPFWFAAYYAAVMTEKFLLARQPKAASRGDIGTLVAISIVISTIYVALPVYMWYLDGDIWQFAAMVMLVAGCLNIYQLRSRVWVVALAYFLPMAGGFVVIATDFWLSPNGGTAFWSALSIALLISGYFVLSVFEAHKTNARTLRVQSQLFKSQKVEALNSLAAGISHDFQNLLSIVQGNLEILQSEPGPDDRRACVSDALAAARKCSELSVQLALCARGVSSRPTRVDPVKVVDKVRMMARHVLPGTINFQTETPSSMIDIHVDESALQAVLLNLIVHARDVSSGSGTISLETYVTETVEPGIGLIRARPKVVFEIIDTHSAVAADAVDAFEAPSVETGRGKPRNGLALVTAHCFAEHAGGEFHIERSGTRGSRARLELPT